MWISKKEYNFLKERAEKNINAEYEILKNKIDQGQDAMKTVEDFSTTIKEFYSFYSKVGKTFEGMHASRNVSFYHAYYKRQEYKEDSQSWEDTCYDSQSIIVIADSYDSAKIKINEYLNSTETDNYRSILVGDIFECIGLDITHGFDDYFMINPIIKQS